MDILLICDFDNFTFRGSVIKNVAAIIRYDALYYEGIHTSMAGSYRVQIPEELCIVLEKPCLYYETGLWVCYANDIYAFAETASLAHFKWQCLFREKYVY